MTEIKASDVAKLRAMTGAGMMDCKQALQETKGDFDMAIDILRTKGQKVANKRADRSATEGAVISKTNESFTFGALLVLNCETDFVAMNEDFIKKAYDIMDLALAKQAKDLEAVKALKLGDHTVESEITNLTGITGEKVDLSYYAMIEAPYVVAYVHPGNRLATLVGLNKGNVEIQVAKDVAMQVAAMNPVSVTKETVPKEVIAKELEIGRAQALEEGKPESIVDKIAEGKLNKFFKESTLLSRNFIKDHKISVLEYLQQFDKTLTVTQFYRFTLND